MGRSRFIQAAVLLAGLTGLATVSAFVAAAPTQVAPRIQETDRTRLREAYRLADQLGDRIWPGWHTAPFALILVTPDYEFLVRHANPSPDFAKLEGDTLLGGPVFYRKRVFPTAMQATFPAVNGVNTIVIGQAELTADKVSTRWVLTVLHEHFHQWVYSRAGYFDDVLRLGLALGDDTGMWMLNYPFPYDSSRVQEKFSAMTRALLDALSQTDALSLGKKVAIFRRAKREFRDALPAEAEKYFAFQLWQEGVARYTEILAGDLAAKAYSPSAEFVALPDFSKFAAVSAAVRTRVLTDLGSLSLAKSRREVVYSVGAAEALLLDRVKPGWRDDYSRKPFRLPDP